MQAHQVGTSAINTILRMITHGSTFSGIGASEVAAEMLGWENVFHCEINPFGRKVLEYYFPKAKSYEDITRTDFSEWRDRITVLTGGFPCQPFSYAGKRRGSEDDRYLWPFMLRCIEQVRPRWFVGENVAGITTMAFPGEDVKVGEQTDLFGACDEVYEKHERYALDEICESLERAGYSVQPMLIPACAVGAPHRRDRVFIVAHRLTEDSLHSGLMGREHDEQGCERNIGNAGARGAERLCGEPMSGTIAESDRLISEWRDRLSLASQRGDSPQRTDGLSALQWHTSYTPSQRRREIYEQVQSELADGAEPFGNGRVRRFFGSEAGGSFEALLPENRWRTFPSVSPVCRRHDGFSSDVVRYLTDDVYDAIQEHYTDKDLRDLREAFSKEEVRQSVGRLYKIPEPQVLLQILLSKEELRQSRQEQGCLSVRSEEVSKGILRKLRKQRPCADSPQGLQLQEQLSRELGISVPTLSHDVALAALAVSKEVESMRSYVRRESLKAYGNAIVPQVMYEIFRCIDEIEQTLNPE